VHGRWAVKRWALVLIVATAASLLGGCANRGTYQVTAVFDDVGDLFSQGSVQTADVRIGTIGKIKLTDNFKARVTLNVRNSVKIPKNSKALLRTTSLLGEKFIELRPNGEP